MFIYLNENIFNPYWFILFLCLYHFMLFCYTWMVKRIDLLLLLLPISNSDFLSRKPWFICLNVCLFDVGWVFVVMLVGVYCWEALSWKLIFNTIMIIFIYHKEEITNIINELNRKCWKQRILGRWGWGRRIKYFTLKHTHGYV